MIQLEELLRADYILLTSIPGEEDLTDVTDYLLPLEKIHIYNLGLVLGISQHKTKAMMDSSTFLDDVIAAWLRREDQVKESLVGLSSLGHWSTPELDNVESLRTLKEIKDCL